MRVAVLSVFFSIAAMAQATIPSGAPLRVALEQRVRIKRVGDPIQGRLVEPVYVVDHVVLPAGTVVEGHIAEIGGVPFGGRLTALFSGNFFPPRDARARFDRAVLSDGARVALRTSASTGTARTAIVAKTEKERRAVRDRIAKMNRAALLAFRTPGKMSRLKSRLFAMLPYHRQAWPAGTLFNAALADPLSVTSGAIAAAPDGEKELRVRLLNPISSATARKGDPVEAVVSRPLFSVDGKLLIPEGSRVAGEVVEARRARFLHRNGKLLFTFRQIRVEGAAQTVQAYVERVEADDGAHLALDAEGGARVSSPKTRFIFPAIAAAVAGLSLHQDYNSEGVADQDIGGRAEAGAVGLGLIGTGVAQASRAAASGIAFAGAGFSIWSTFVARGADVVLPANTPVEVSVRARGDGAR